MSHQLLKWCTITLTIGGIIFLTFLALNKGPAELMALAAVVTASAALLSSIEAKGK